MKINGLSHITFICKDLAKTSHMLKELFSAQEIYDSGDKTFSTSKEKFFKIANIWIAIMEGQATEKTNNHVAFHINEEHIPFYKQKINDLNLVLLPGRSRKKEEGESLYFYDYDNHLFELHTGDLDTRLSFYNEA